MERERNERQNHWTVDLPLASSSKELHQIVDTLTNKHPPKMLPTIYHSADLPSFFIKHFSNKVEKVRANIASEPIYHSIYYWDNYSNIFFIWKIVNLTQFIILSLDIISILTLDLLILSLNGFHLIWLIVHTTSLYLIIVLPLLLCN